MKQLFLKSTMLSALIAATLFVHAQKVNFKFTPADGSVYTTTVSTKTNMTQNVMGQEVKVISDMATVNTNTIKNNGANKDFTSTYEKLEMISNINGQEVKFSSVTDDAQSKILKSIVGKSYTATLNEKGEIQAITGNEALSKIAADDESLKQVVSKNAIEESIKSSFDYIPGKEVSVGDSWVTNSTMNNMVKINYKTVYKLIAVDGDMATINFDAAVATDGDVPFESQGMTMDMNISGTSKGVLKINIKDGMPAETTSVTDLKGVVKVTGMEIPLELKTDVSQKTTKK